jgi:hypothetical protein
MTTIEISLPEDLAQRAKSAGLLSDSAIQHLLEEAMRRHPGRALLDIAKRIHDDGIPPMSDEDVVAEVKAVRAERRARLGAVPRLPKSEPGSDAGHRDRRGVSGYERRSLEDIAPPLSAV